MLYLCPYNNCDYQHDDPAEIDEHVEMDHDNSGLDEFDDPGLLDPYPEGEDFEDYQDNYRDREEAERYYWEVIFPQEQMELVARQERETWEFAPEEDWDDPDPTDDYDHAGWDY